MTYNFPENENNILKFWADNQIFDKLREKNKRGKRWSFLDGPITANNPMGVHHAWGRTYKDLLQRYHAMQGFDERYQNGFDCQGLWVEVEVEKELGFKTKKDIEVYGIGKFVEKCKERVLKYSAIQTAQSQRLGQWMDWEHSYYTMSDENNYAIWHFLKKCWELGYLYKGRDSVPWCPRCGTAISQHEILTEEYKEITHDSIYFQLPIVGRDNEFLLVWTTTPWTLPANIAVAVDEKIDYALVDNGTGKFWVAKELAEKIFKGEHGILKTIKGKELVGLKYSFAFDNLPKVKEVAEKNPKTFHTVIATDDRIMPINMEDGTGLVHTAVSAGQEDFHLGKKLGLPLIEVIGEDASYLDGLGEFSGQNAKKNPAIILDYLKDNGAWVFKILPYKHKYPTCWRCKTELVWRVVDEWYISMEKLRKPLEKIVKKINWIPAFGKERELDWLKNMHDWLISKKRYWGLALPIFECTECKTFEVIGSKEELKKRAVEGWETFEGNSPHRPWVDTVKIKCKKCKKLVSRIKDVGNPWLDAGIVPFSTMKYFEDKPYWKKWFPAQIVCESFPGQFKNWFYSLLVMSAVLENVEPMKTIFGFASVRDEKGEEMHKSKGNAIWFDDAVEKIGADPMRWMYARQNPAENMNFGFKAAEEIKRKLLTLYNTYTFFETYVKKEEFPADKKVAPKNILDAWIISKMEHVVSNVEFNLERYDMAKATLGIEDFFINDLSLWYVRRSRKRFHEDSNDRQEAVGVLYFVLLNTAKLIAPIMPFFAEQMYQKLKTSDMPESVHLCDWPQSSSQTDLDLEQNMDEVRATVTLALAERMAQAIKVRQPLASLKIKNKKSKIKDNQELLNLVKDEVNVKEIIFDDTIENKIALDTHITPGLKEEGMVRDIIRLVQDWRKEQGLRPEDKIPISISVLPEEQLVLEKNKELLKKEIRATEILFQEPTSDQKISIKKM
jgi:isoleucyl-tRNA synthetase